MTLARMTITPLAVPKEVEEPTLEMRELELIQHANTEIDCVDVDPVGVEDEEGAEPQDLDGQIISLEDPSD